MNRKEFKLQSDFIAICSLMGGCLSIKFKSSKHDNSKGDDHANLPSTSGVMNFQYSLNPQTQWLCKCRIMKTDTTFTKGWKKYYIYLAFRKLHVLLLSYITCFNWILLFWQKKMKMEIMWMVSELINFKHYCILLKGLHVCQCFTWIFSSRLVWCSPDIINDLVTLSICIFF